MKAKTALQQDKDKLYNEIRHMIAKHYSCPEHVTMVDLLKMFQIMKGEK